MTNVYFQPIKRVSISDSIKDRILSMIREQEVEPGDKLYSERELCSIFQVSRTSVREAIEGLCAAGVLDKRPDGTYISEKPGNLSVPFGLFANLNSITFDEAFEARTILDSENAALAAIKATDEDLKVLEKTLKKADTAKNAEDLAKYAAAFHQAIANATHNKILISSYEMVYEFIAKNPRVSGAKTKEHHTIFEAIKAHDPDAAKNAMLKHLEEAQENYIK